MAKENGIGFAVVVDNAAGSGQTISNDIYSVQLATPKGVADITGLNSAAHERLHLLADGSVTLAMGFNDASNQNFDVFKTVPSSAASRTFVGTISAQIMTMELLFTDFSVNRSADGNITTSAPGQVSNGTAPAWST